MRFSELAGAGIELTPGLVAIYERAQGAWPDRPIDFDLDFQHASASGGFRIFPDRVQIWLKRSADDPSATLVHELAHAIVAKELHPPRLTPNAPTGVHRMILSDLIYLPEHQRTHELMDEYGVSVEEEAAARSRAFLRNIATAQLGPDGSNVHLSVGYAMMLTCLRHEPLVQEIMSTMRALPGPAAAFGEAIAGYVQRKRDESLYEDAVNLMNMAGVGPEFQRCVLSDEEFVRRYGF